MAREGNLSCTKLCEITEDQIELLLKTHKTPKSWEKDSLVCFRFLDKLFEASSNIEGKMDILIRNALGCLDPSLNLPTQISNLKKKVSKFLSKHDKGFCQVVDYLYKVNDNNQVGTECAKFCIDKIFLESLSENKILPSDFQRLILTNGIVLELNKYRCESGKTWKDLFLWVFNLSLSRSNFEEKSLRQAVERAKLRVEALIQKGDKEGLQEFRSEEFRLPRQLKDSFVEEKDISYSADTDSAAIIFEYDKEVNTLISTLDECNEHIQLLTNLISDQTKLDKSQKDELSKVKSELTKLKIEQNTTLKKLNDAMKKLGNLSARNVNKKMKRRDLKIKSLETENKQQAHLIAEFEANKLSEIEEINEENNKVISDINRKLDEALKAKENAQKLKWYYKSKSQSFESQINLEKKGLNSQIKNLKETIRILENEITNLEEQMTIFFEDKIVKTFQNGKYTAEVRAVYEDLLCFGVGTENVEKVIRSVLSNLGGIECGRLPKGTFSRYMFLEARRLAQIQVAEKLLADWDPKNYNTLYTDGTSKYGHHYSTCDISDNNGNVFVTGLRDISSGDSQTYVDCLKEIFSDIAACADIEGGCSLGLEKIVTSIKNTMSDRHVVQKSFNDILTNYRKEVLPTVIQGWDDLNENGREKIVRMNDFFCGLHFVVGLADQAEAALKVWDEALYEGEAVGSVSHGGYSIGESGTLRLVRTVCKAVQERGCEKSGRPVQFLTYLRAETNFKSVPLAPFKGNRFNILFHNAAGVYFLYDVLKVFFERVKDENKLLKAVYHDLQVPSFIAGCRALGIIDKLVTTPLWHILEQKTVHILDMSKHYQRMLSCFEQWSSDAGDVLTGKARLFLEEQINEDEIFLKLIEPNLIFDAMTKQILELVFGSFLVKTTRMLADHLEGGKYNQASDEVREESKGVLKTNIVPERDFSMLDRLMAQKPNATTMVYEGIIMFSKNDTAGWRNSLEPEKRARVMELARKSKVEQRRLYKERKIEIRRVQEQKMADSLEEKQRKELKNRIQKEQLVEKLEEYGGLWKTSEQIDQNLSNLVTNKEKLAALHTQIQFRKKVLGAVHPDKKVFQMSTDGKLYTIVQLHENLLKIILHSEQERVLPQPVNVVNMPVLADHDKIKEQIKKYKDQANKDNVTSSVENVNRKRKKQSRVTSKDKRSKPDEQTLPVVILPGQLIGKKVSHYCFGEEGEMEWFRGTVVAMQPGKSKRNPDFLISYDDYESQLFIFSFNEFKDNKVVLVTVDIDDFVGKAISQRFEDETKNESWWENGRVLSVENRSDENPEFVVEYDALPETTSEDGEEERGPEMCTFHLFEDYLRNDLRFLH